MICKKCYGCGDKVLILKAWKGNNLCLDCLQKAETDGICLPNIISKNEIISRKQMTSREGKRICLSCGWKIPEDAKYCPYCKKKFW